MVIPSTMRWGALSIRLRFTKEPGSPSSALQIMYLGVGLAARRNPHLRPVGKHVAVADNGINFQHVRRVEGQLQVHHQIVVVRESGHLGIGRIGCTLGIETASGAIDLFRNIETHNHPGLVELLGTVVA